MAELEEKIQIPLYIIFQVGFTPLFIFLLPIGLKFCPNTVSKNLQ